MSLRHPVNKRHNDSRTSGEALADGIAAAIGSWRFLIAQSFIVVAWVGFNLLALFRFHWDPYPFILLNLAFSTQAAYTGPVLLLAGNRQAQKDRDTLEHTFADTEKMLTEIQRNTELTLQIDRRLQAAIEGTQSGAAPASGS